MITDVFITRYQQRFLYSDLLPDNLTVFLMQAAQIIADDIYIGLSAPKFLFQRAHDKLCREIGAVQLADGKDYDQICIRFLTEHYDLWNNQHGIPDQFFKLRISLIELMFREFEEYFRNPSSTEQDSKRVFRSLLFTESKNNSKPEEGIAHLNDRISELNLRMQRARLPLHYHNGFIQIEEDLLITKQISEPFWKIVSDPKWFNVDIDLKEAIDRRDKQMRDAPLYAAKALESTIKIICTEKGWVTGKEKGAANYIDNLLSQKHGRFIDVWEADTLKLFFSNVRNPHGHGPGSESQPALSNEQITWAIENCIIWIKNLVRRM